MDESAVIVIEWAERLSGYPLPPNQWLITISGDGDELRRIVISAGSQRVHVPPWSDHPAKG
jgi:tRNA A37 threonylcarbamoyladenosine biosynthesis protein TsaE